MAKVGTEKITIFGKEPYKYLLKFDVNVNKDGTFVTTLPIAFVEMLELANIQTSVNQLGNAGYFTDKTYAGLISKVSSICKEYESRELVSETTVIKYVIQTTCMYCLDINGNIVPNASGEWTKCPERQQDDWKEGTETQHAGKHNPFGLMVYAKPVFKRTYKYKSGKTKEEYKDYSAFSGGDGDAYYIRWLAAISSISPPNGKIMEIEYTEDIAKFFVDLLKGICAINEKIKDFTSPEAIKQIAENKQKFLF